MTETEEIGQKKKKASIEALKFIYYVIVGIAFTEALLVFLTPNFVSVFLAFAFLFTICRFIHGASLHFDVIEGIKQKPLVDFIGFFLQASFFFLMSNYLNNPVMYVVFCVCMLTSDFIWIIVVIKVEKAMDFENTAKQWLKSDIIIIISSILLILLIPAIFECLSLNFEFSLIISSLLIMILSIITCFWDYKSNYNFYFPG